MASHERKGNERQARGFRRRRVGDSVWKVEKCLGMHNNTMTVCTGGIAVKVQSKICRCLIAFVLDLMRLWCELSCTSCAMTVAVQVITPAERFMPVLELGCFEPWKSGVAVAVCADAKQGNRGGGIAGRFRFPSGGRAMRGAILQSLLHSLRRKGNCRHFH